MSAAKPIALSALTAKARHEIVHSFLCATKVGESLTQILKNQYATCNWQTGNGFSLSDSFIHQSNAVLQRGAARSKMHWHYTRHSHERQNFQIGPDRFYYVSKIARSNVIVISVPFRRSLEKNDLVLNCLGNTVNFYPDSRNCDRRQCKVRISFALPSNPSQHDRTNQRADSAKRAGPCGAISSCCWRAVIKGTPEKSNEHHCAASDYSPLDKGNNFHKEILT